MYSFSVILSWDKPSVQMLGEDWCSYSRILIPMIADLLWFKLWLLHLKVEWRHCVFSRSHTLLFSWALSGFAEQTDPNSVESNWNEISDNFDNMNLKESLPWGIYAYGSEKPSATQQGAIIPYIEGCDLIVQAQSGTGKKDPFAISILIQLKTEFKTQAQLWPPPETWLNKSKRKYGLLEIRW